MFLTYVFRGKKYTLNLEWTNEEGNSSIFRGIEAELARRHKSSCSLYREAAERLDKIADQIYKVIFSNDKNTLITYNPALPDMLKANLKEMAAEIAMIPSKGKGRIFYALFQNVLLKLRDTVNIYIDDNRLQDDIRRDKRYHEQATETTDDLQMSAGFEETLIQMLEISNILSCLTETQRRRLVAHLILGYSISEIAAKESATKQSVQISIKLALTKIKEISN